MGGGVGEVRPLFVAGEVAVVVKASSVCNPIARLHRLGKWEKGHICKQEESCHSSPCYGCSQDASIC